MAPQLIKLSHLPPDLSLYISAYTSVTNAAYLRSQLLASNQEYNYAFLDAKTILSTTHLLSACFRALTDNLHGRLKSNNVHGEIVFCLSSNNNIGDAFRRFGIGDGTTDVVMIKVGDGGEGEEEKVIEAMGGKVEGVEVEWTEIDAWLGRTCDLDLVRKNYKLGKPVVGKKGAVNGMKHGEEDKGMKKEKERREIERVVLGMMALRGAT